MLCSSLLTIPLFCLYLTNMLLLSLNFPDANTNLLLGSHRLSAPSDQLSVVLKTSGNAPTLPYTGLLSDLFATNTID